MRNKIFTILGILIVVVALSAYLIVDTKVKNSGGDMGMDILVVKEDIKEGTVIKTVEQAHNLFGVKQVAQIDVVPNAIEVNAINIQGDGLLGKIKGLFTTTSLKVKEGDLQALVNKKVVVDVYKNQQMLSGYLSDDAIEFEEDERYFAVPITFIGSVGAEVKKGDFVDLWINFGEDHPEAGKSQKIIEALKIITLKDQNNAEGEGEIIPAIVVFKLKEEQIVVISEKINHGSLFLTKWGITPKEQGVVVESTKTDDEEMDDIIEIQDIEIDAETETID